MTYLRDPETGNVYLESDNPQAAWTPEEWTAILAAKESQVNALQEQVDSLMRPKTAPDAETLDLWNNLCDQQATETQERLATLKAELAELKAV